MIIQIRPGFFINSDAIVSLVIYPDHPGQPNTASLLCLRDGSTHRLSENVARGLLMLLEANDSLLIDDSDASPQLPALTTRIAQYLQNHTNGEDSQTIAMALDIPSTRYNEVVDALLSLNNEHVAICIVGLWYHCSNSYAQIFLRQFRSNPDPSNVIVTQPVVTRPGSVDSEQIVDPKTQS